MKEQKSEKLYQALGGVEPALLSEAENALPRRRKVVWLKWAAAAACLALLLSTFALPGHDNAFTVTAYAMETDENGTMALRPFDGNASYPHIRYGGLSYDENFYLPISLGYKGTNIEHVTFSTENGFFFIQNREELEASFIPQPEEGFYDDATDWREPFPPFQNLGRTLVLDDSSKDRLFLENVVLWGCERELLWTEDAEVANGGYYTIPDTIELTATALFKDGTTQEVPVTLHYDKTTATWRPNGE